MKVKLSKKMCKCIEEVYECDYGEKKSIDDIPKEDLKKILKYALNSARIKAITCSMYPIP